MKPSKLLIFFLSIVCVIALFSCKADENNSNTDNNGQNSPTPPAVTVEKVIYSAKSIPNIVVGEGASETDAIRIKDLILLKANINCPIVFDDAEEAEHEIILGKVNRALSEEAYDKLSKAEREGEDDVGFLIYSDTTSIAVAFDQDSYGINRAYIDAVDYLVENYITDTSLTMEGGVVHQALFNVIERQEELDAKMIEERWETKLSQISSRLDNKELAEDIVKSLKGFRRLFTDNGDIVSWIANLYCPETGGFYYSNSARNTHGYLPDLESTSQALGIIEELLAIDYDGNLSTLFGEEIVEKFIKFAKDMQDPKNGYFYHPQWSRQLTEQHLSRMGRDINNALNILRRFGASPTYDTPTGVKGDGMLSDGTPVSLILLSPPLSQGKISAVSKVVLANVEDANIPAHMRTKESFEAYLASLDINGAYYSVGNTLESQAPQFVQRDKVLAERGEDYRLADICEEWMSSHQNTETGLWDLNGVIDFEAVNGLLKLGSTYTKLGKKIPNALKGMTAAVSCMVSEEVPEIICDIFNTWYAVSIVYDNLTSFGTAEEQEAVIAARDALFASFPKMIDATTEKVMVFAKPDGSYSFNQEHSSEMSQGMPVAVPKSVEGDVNATMIASVSISGHIYSLLGIGKVPIFTPADRLRFIDVFAEMGYIIKDEIPEITPLKFEDEQIGESPAGVDSIMNSSGSIKVSKKYNGRGNALRFISNADGASVGSDEIQFPTPTSFYGAPCNLLDLDMCIMPETDESYFAQLYLFPNMYMIGINRIGDTIRLYEESSYTASKSFSHDLGVSAKIGEWFNLRIEYYTGTTETLRIKVYFNGELVCVSDNFFDAAAKKLDGKASSPQDYKYGRLLVMSNANADILLDNVLVDQNYTIYEPVLDPENQPLRNVDSPDTGRITYDFEAEENGSTPEGFTPSVNESNISTEDYNGNKKLAIGSGGAKLTLPTNHRGSGANSQTLGFKLTVDESSAVGSKYEISFNEFMYKYRSLISFHLVVAKDSEGKYLAIAEGESGKTGTTYSHIRLPLGEELDVRIEFFFNESAALVFINNELMASNGSVLSGQRRFLMGNVTITNLTAAAESKIYLDDLVCEKIKGDYETSAAPTVDRVTQSFDSYEGLDFSGLFIDGGRLSFTSVSSDGGYLNLPVNARANFTTYGLIKMSVIKDSRLAGGFEIAFADKDGNKIAAFALISSKNGTDLHEVTENGIYPTPLATIGRDSFTISIEFSPAKESFNVLIGDECIACSSVLYSTSSSKLNFEKAIISAGDKSPFFIDDLVAETTGGLFKIYEPSVANEDNTSEVLTYEQSSFVSIPKRLTTAFVSSGSMLRVRESVIREKSSKVMEFATRPGGNDILTFSQTKTLLGANAVAFETNMMINSESNFYVDVEPMSSGYRVYQLRINARTDGNITASSPDFSEIIAVKGEWFKIRIEYTFTEFDYDHDGDADMILRLYVNDDLVGEGNTPYTGTYYEEDTVTKLRFFTHSDSNGEISFDNTIFEQCNMEYEEPPVWIPEIPGYLSYENGHFGNPAPTFNAIGSSLEIREMTVASEITKVLTFVTASGGNDYVNFVPTLEEEGANAITFETDMMIDPRSDSAEFAIEPITAGSSRGFRLVVTAKKNGNVTIASDGNKAIPSTVIAKSGEWFHIRIDYMTPGIDYDLDGVTDILYKVYINGAEEPIATGYQPYRSGEYYSPDNIVKYRLFTFSSTDADICLDNSSFRRVLLEADPAPEPIIPPEPEVEPETPFGPGHTEGEDIHDDEGWTKENG